MTLTLKRLTYDADGVFSTILDETGNEVAKGLEHAYDSGRGDGSYLPKTPAGTYTCQRSMHLLHGMTQPFETFQVMNVPGHSNILIHWGNYNDDSDGCILVGRNVVPRPDRPAENMITSSKNMFLKIMDLQKGLDSFTLVVED